MVKQNRFKKVRFIASKQGLIFLIFATLVWVLSALSEEYSTSIPVELKIKNNSTGLILLNEQIDIHTLISSSGFSIIYYRIFPLSIILNTEELTNVDFKNPIINTQFLNTHLKKKYPSIKFLDNFLSKKFSLPITFSAQKSFTPILKKLPLIAEGYQLISPLSFSVENVNATGGKEILDSLEFAVFELTSNSLIKNDFILKAVLSDSINSLVNWDIKEITVSGQVDRFSDIYFDLPISIINVPDSLRVELTVNQIQLKFAAPISIIKSINKDNFIAIADFKESINGQLPVRVSGLPETSKQVLINPSTVSYLILE